MSDCKHCHGEHDVALHAEQKRAHEVGMECQRCNERSRDAHLKWARGRALACLPSDPREAINSMVSDLRKHHAWRDDVAQLVCLDAQMRDFTPQAARTWIEGWN